MGYGDSLLPAQVLPEPLVEFLGVDPQSPGVRMDPIREDERILGRHKSRVDVDHGHVHGPPDGPHPLAILVVDRTLAVADGGGPVIAVIVVGDDRECQQVHRGLSPLADLANDRLQVICVLIDGHAGHHPTVLAWKNRLLSPDYVGAMRETVEKNTGGAPCLFLQGASGELAPREDHSNETTIADANGRRLGLAVLATLESMLPARTGLTFGGVVESGAPLAIWKRRLFEPCTVLEAARVEVALPLKPHLESAAELRRQLDSRMDQVQERRARRKLRIVDSVGSGSSCLMPAWIWRIGKAFLVGHPNEAYSLLQTTLRRCFPDHAVVVMNVVNGHIGYLCSPELHEENVYTVWQGPFGPQALPRLIEACRVQMNRMLEG